MTTSAEVASVKKPCSDVVMVNVPEWREERG
jgi:hypothetical protein